jgi:hypothetical protein
MTRSFLVKLREAIALTTIVVRAGAVSSEKGPFVQSWQAGIAPISTHREAIGYKPPLLCEFLTSNQDLRARPGEALRRSRAHGVQTSRSLY